jgi:DNA-binding NtrC family response regulator
MNSAPEKTNLEKVVKDKIEPLLEEAMQRFLGVTIRELENDITEKIEHNKLVGILVRTDLPFKAAKKEFKKEFLMRTIQTHYGNISEVADIVGLDRRSIHRDLKSLNVDVKKLREKLYKPKYFEKEAVDQMLRKTLEQYKSVIRSEKLGQMVEYVPELSEQIVNILPDKTLRWKDAEREFERVYLTSVLKENNNDVRKAAQRIGIRYETLLRKSRKVIGHGLH